MAEDDRVNRLIMERLLSRQGHRVVTVPDGRHCLKALDDESFDLLFMDIQMPEMDGVETTRLIRARTDAKKRLPIIALTAHTMDGDREQFLAAGMDDYLSKPVDVEAIRQLLRSRFASGDGAPQ